MTDESGAPAGEVDGDALGRGAGRRRRDGRRAGALDDYLRLEYPAESWSWALRDTVRTPTLRARLLARWRRRRGRPPGPPD